MLKKQKLAQDLQTKLGVLFSSLPLSANQWTLLTVPIAVLGFYFAYLQLPFHSLALFILAGAIDALDGAVARAKKQVSAKGAYIDGITDRIVEFLFVMSFLCFPLPPFALSTTLLLIVILFFGSSMTAFATAYAEHRGVADSKKIAKQPGLLPRTERLLLLFLALAFVSFSPSTSSLLLLAAASLSFITFCQRFWYFAR